MSVTNSHQISIELAPWTENGFRVSMLHIREGIYGVIPGGEIELIRGDEDETLKYVTNQETGTLTIEDNQSGGGGIRYEFNIFVTTRTNVNNRTTLCFVVLPGTDLEKGKKFWTGLLSETYDGPDDALDNIWPGEKDIREKSNISDQTKLYRDNEDGYSFLKRLCMSWKNETLFAFGWDGLLIKKRVESGELLQIIGGENLWNQYDNIKLSYNNKRNYTTFSPWEDEYKDEDDSDIRSLSKSSTRDDNFKKLEPKYVVSTMKNSIYKIHSKDGMYRELTDNYEENKRFSDSGGYAGITIVGERFPDATEWKLGDTVKYLRAEEKKQDAPELTCIVAANELFIAQNEANMLGPHGKPFEWTTKLWAVNESEIGGWIQEPQTNPENKEQKTE